MRWQELEFQVEVLLLQQLKLPHVMWIAGTFLVTWFCCKKNVILLQKNVILHQLLSLDQRNIRVALFQRNLLVFSFFHPCFVHLWLPLLLFDSEEGMRVKWMLYVRVSCSCNLWSFFFDKTRCLSRELVPVCCMCLSDGRWLAKPSKKRSSIRGKERRSKKVTFTSTFTVLFRVVRSPWLEDKDTDQWYMCTRVSLALTMMMGRIDRQDVGYTITTSLPVQQLKHTKISLSLSLSLFLN